MTRSESTFEVVEGQILAEKYRVEAVIGAGGVGVVVRALHLVLNDRVALKFLRAAVVDSAMVSRFLREAQAAARIKSPHVGRVLDVGTLASGSPYLVMEYLDGEDLSRALARNERIPVATAISYALQICEGLAAAHALGIVHRDIKPSNLFLTRDTDDTAIVKVLDFGISKTISGEGLSSLTETRTAMGTPLYMSPEQMRSARTVDARADIWSLGVVLYELLTGRLPFEAETLPELVALLVDRDVVPPPPRRFRADIPRELEEVMLRCLSKDVALRYPDVAALADALERVAGEAAIQSSSRIRRILAASKRAPADPTRAPAAGEVDDSTQRVVAPEFPEERNTATAFGNTGKQRHDRSRKVLLVGVPLAFFFGILVHSFLSRTPAPAVPPRTDVRSAAALSPVGALPAVSPSATANVPGVSPAVAIEDLPLERKRGPKHAAQEGAPAGSGVSESESEPPSRRQVASPRRVPAEAPASSARPQPSAAEPQKGSKALPDDLANPYLLEVNPYR